MPALRARYFDGRSSRARDAQLAIAEGRLELHAEDLVRDLDPRALRFSERMRHGPCVILLPDGGRLETEDGAGYRALREALGCRERPVERWQQSWRSVLILAMLVCAGLYAAYRWGVPTAAEGIVGIIPAGWEARLGTSTLALIDERLAAPTRLSGARQAALRDVFDRLARDQAPQARLVFRSLRGKPNAFALPGGIVILSDELVALHHDDDALAGVLAHELGHVAHRHMTRGLVHAAALSVVAALLRGDISSIAVTIPASLGHWAYSRDFELDADRYACGRLRAVGIPAQPLAELLERLSRSQPGAEAPAYLSTHPPTAARIDYFRHCENELLPAAGA